VAVKPLGLAIWVSVALVAALGAALLGAHRTPRPGAETTAWLAAESVSVDGDRLDEPSDRDRFEARFGERAAGVVVDQDDAKRYAVSGAWSALAGRARSALGPGGPYAVQALLVIAAAGLAWSAARSRLGASAAAELGVVAIVATPLAIAALTLEPRALDAAAAALAAWAVWWRRPEAPRHAEGVYDGPSGRRPLAWRWPVAGAAFGIVLTSSVAFAPLAWPLVAAAPRERRGVASALFAGAATGVVLLSVALWGAPWQPIAPDLAPRLLLWSTIGLVVGRGIGLVAAFLPLLLLVGSTGREEGRRWVLPAVAVAVGLQILIAPFDFVEGGLPVGNAWFLAPFVLWLAAVAHDDGRRWRVAVALVALPFVAPALLGAAGLEATGEALASRVDPVTSLLPAPSTLRRIPGEVELERPGLRVFVDADAVAFDDAGRLRLARRAASLVVIADRPLGSFRVELGAGAPSRIEVSGAEAGNTTFRPGGDVAFDVALAPGDARRHPVWWARDAWVYDVRLRLPSLPERPLDFDVPFGRSSVPVAGES